MSEFGFNPGQEEFVREEEAPPIPENSQDVQRDNRSALFRRLMSQTAAYAAVTMAMMFPGRSEAATAHQKAQVPTGPHKIEHRVASPEAQLIQQIELQEMIAAGMFEKSITTEGEIPIMQQMYSEFLTNNKFKKGQEDQANQEINRLNEGSALPLENVGHIGDKEAVYTRELSADASEARFDNVFLNSDFHFGDYESKDIHAMEDQYIKQLTETHKNNPKLVSEIHEYFEGLNETIFHDGFDTAEIPTLSYSKDGKNTIVYKSALTSNAAEVQKIVARLVAKTKIDDIAGTLGNNQRSTLYKGIYYSTYDLITHAMANQLDKSPMVQNMIKSGVLK